MPNFTDAKKREWTVQVTGRTISEAAGRGIDLNLALLARAAGGDALELMTFKTLGQFIDLCYLGCSHNAAIASGKVTEEDFKDSITGESLIPALLATVGAICDCFGLKLEKKAAPDPTGAADADEKSG